MNNITSISSFTNGRVPKNDSNNTRNYGSTKTCIYGSKNSRQLKKIREMFNGNKLKRNYYNGESESDNEGDSPLQPDIAAMLSNLEKKKVFRNHNHIYFRCTVTLSSVNTLCNLIEQYTREQDAIKSDLTTMITISKPIYLHITSEGGDVFAGFLAYDYIKNSKIPIYTVAEGIALSSGANMMMAGHLRFMTKNSYVMVHQLNVTKMGTETYHNMMDEVANSIDFMSKIYKIYLDNARYKEGTALDDILTKEKIENHMLHDIFWNYDTCKRYGLVDGVYTNYTDHDTKDIEQYVKQCADDKTNHRVYPIDRLDDLKPSKQVIAKIKENMELKKNKNMINLVQKYMTQKSSTDDEDAIINDTDEEEGSILHESNNTTITSHI
jgi:ATP-dependent protease ClpP protease subunit